MTIHMAGTTEEDTKVQRWQVDGKKVGLDSLETSCESCWMAAVLACEDWFP